MPHNLNTRSRFGWFENEEQLAIKCLDELSPYFHVKREVPLTHWTGKPLRVDAVLWPKDPSQWKDGDRTVFAVEFKMPYGMGSFARWSAQCIDYYNSFVEGRYGRRRLRVFACPGFAETFTSYTPLTQAEHRFAYMYASRQLWQLGVGELIHERQRLVANATAPTFSDDGWKLIHSGGHPIWTQNRGVIAKNMSLNPKIGSR